MNTQHEFWIPTDSGLSMEQRAALSLNSRQPVTMQNFRDKMAGKMAFLASKLNKEHGEGAAASEASDLLPMTELMGETNPDAMGELLVNSDWLMPLLNRVEFPQSGKLEPTERQRVKRLADAMDLKSLIQIAIEA